MNHNVDSKTSMEAFIPACALILLSSVFALGGCPASTGSKGGIATESPRPGSTDSANDVEGFVDGTEADEKESTPVEKVPELAGVFSIKVPADFGRVVSIGMHGQWIGIGTDTNRVHILDGKTKKPVWSSGGLEQQPMSISFSADGSHIMAGGKALSNYIWKVASGKGKHYRTWHRKQGNMHVLSGDGSTLIREDIRKSVRWYELETYKMKWLAQGRRVAVSGDGRLIAMFNRKGVMEIRDSITGKLYHDLKNIPAKAHYALNNDGKVVFYIRESETGWSPAGVDAKTGEELFETKDREGKVRGFQLSPTKHYGIVWGDFGLSVIELAEGKTIISLPDRFRLAAIYGDKVCKVARDSKSTIKCGHIHVP